ncbi:unnamed protein product [Cylicostephanus goldi]|uniref:alpha-galactosidase n=1 Tax=Cylicostephanus goldi TaxID=71465 RepID=A0A3P6QK05_CYLGO|nr:unnamed protein product [Cylicostephanus goldi]
MSNDLRAIDPQFKDILQNRDVIAIDQDPLAIMGRLVLNTVQFALSRVGMNNTAGYQVKDLWSKQDMGVMKPSDTLKVSVPPTGISMLKATVI